MKINHGIKTGSGGAINWEDTEPEITKFDILVNMFQEKKCSECSILLKD